MVFWAGLCAFLAALAYVVVQLLQVAGVLKFPWDEILIYGTSLCIVIPFVLEILALHYLAPAEKKFWSHAALIFSIIYAVFVTANYVVQLATVIPMKLKGTSDEIRILEQTPHSMFWDFDAVGYIFMGFATLMAVPVFERKGFQKWVRLSFLANALVTPLIAVVYFYPVYSEKLLVFGFAWGVTAPVSMLLLAIMFRKKLVLVFPEKNKIAMREINDWRLQGQERYLQDAKLVCKNYADRKTKTDHDHCEFCLTKFSDCIEDALKFGYTTLDDYRWICTQCFEDFKYMFNFEVITLSGI